MMEGNKKEYAKGIDWVYLAFLFLITNQAILSLKLLGIIFICIARPDFKFGITKGRIPKFYLYIIVLSVVAYFIHIRDFSSNYLAAFAVGNLIWLFGLIAFHQTRITVEKYGPEGTYKLMKAFTILNLIFSLVQLIGIIQITGQLNPYHKLPFPYGMSTGDNIYGFFMENSYYNMMASAITSVYFIYKRNITYALLAATTLILVFGNFGTLVYMAVLGAMLLTGITVRTTGLRKITLLRNITPPGRYGLYIPLIGTYIILFFVLMSPENMEYVVEKIQSKVFSADGSSQNYRYMIRNNPDPKPEAFDPYKEAEVLSTGLAPKYSLSEHTTVLGTAGTPLDARKKMSDQYVQKLQGKALSLKETKQYLTSSPGNFLFGSGTARFSSLIAQKMGGFDSSRIFMKVLPRFTSPEYAQNHKLIVQSRHDADNEYRSNANWPDSVYNQILGEYGLIGAILFVVFYLWYFIKDIRYMTYTFWVLCMMIPFASLSYMFEALSIVIIFELLAITDITNMQQKADG